MAGLLQRIYGLPFLCLLLLFGGMQLVFWQAAIDPFGPVEQLWCKVLIPLAVIPLLWTRLRSFAALAPDSAGKCMVGLIAWLFVAGVFSSYQPNGMKTAFEYAFYASVFFVPAVLDQPEQRRVLAVFLLSCTVAGFYGIMQHFGIDPWKWSTDFGGRPLGTIGNPNFFAGHLCMAWAMSLAWVLVAKRKKLPAISFAILSLVQVYSFTVGAWLGMATTTVALWAFLLTDTGATLREKLHINKKQLLAAAGALLLAAVIFFQTPPGEKLQKRLVNEKSVSVTNRMMMWKVAVKMWGESPLIGKGWGSYRPEYPNVQADILESEKDKNWNYVVTWLPHENYLYWLAETGLVGTLLFLGTWFFSVRRAWPRLEHAGPIELGAMLAIAGMAGESLLNTFSNIPPSAVAHFFLLGILAYRPAEVKRDEAKPVFSTAVVVAGVIALVSAFFAGQTLVAHRLIKQAKRADKQGNPAMAAAMLGKAAAWNIGELTPQSLVGVNYEHAEALRKIGRIQESVLAYKRDLKDNPYAPELRNMLGANLGQLAQTDPALSPELRAAYLVDARKHLNMALRVSPDYVSAMVNLGIAHVQLKDFSQAEKWWRKTLELEPENAEAKNYLQILAGMREGK